MLSMTTAGKKRESLVLQLKENDDISFSAIESWDEKGKKKSINSISDYKYVKELWIRWFRLKVFYFYSIKNNNMINEICRHYCTAKWEKIKHLPSNKNLTNI